MKSTRWVFRCAAMAGAIATIAAAAPAGAQSTDTTHAAKWSAKFGYSGPRFGFTYLPQSILDTLDRRGIKGVHAVITQFGWQYEKAFYNSATGPTALNEWAFLVGGLEQGKFLPSASWIVGVRSHGGVEFGVGPNITPAGVAFAMAGGRSFESGGMHFPVSLALVSSQSGMRVSALFGFTLH